MEAEGSAQNPAAQDVLANCLKSPSVGLIELITPKVCARVASHCPAVQLIELGRRMPPSPSLRVASHDAARTPPLLLGHMYTFRSHTMLVVWDIGCVG